MIIQLKADLKVEVKNEMVLRGQVSDIDQKHNKATKDFSYQILQQMIECSRFMISENEQIEVEQNHVQEEIKEYSSALNAYNSHSLVIENQIIKNEKSIGYNDYYR